MNTTNDKFFPPMNEVCPSIGTMSDTVSRYYEQQRQQNQFPTQQQSINQNQFPYFLPTNTNRFASLVNRGNDINFHRKRITTKNREERHRNTIELLQADLIKRGSTIYSNVESTTRRIIENRAVQKLPKEEAGFVLSVDKYENNNSIDFNPTVNSNVLIPILLLNPKSTHSSVSRYVDKFGLMNVNASRLYTTAWIFEYVNTFDDPFKAALDFLLETDIEYNDRYSRFTSSIFHGPINDKKFTFNPSDVDYVNRQNGLLTEFNFSLLSRYSVIDSIKNYTRSRNNEDEKMSPELDRYFSETLNQVKLSRHELRSNDYDGPLGTPSNLQNAKLRKQFKCRKRRRILSTTVTTTRRRFYRDDYYDPILSDDEDLRANERVYMNDNVPLNSDRLLELNELEFGNVRLPANEEFSNLLHRLKINGYRDYFFKLARLLALDVHVIMGDNKCVYRYTRLPTLLKNVLDKQNSENTKACDDNKSNFKKANYYSYQLEKKNQFQNANTVTMRDMFNVEYEYFLDALLEKRKLKAQSELYDTIYPYVKMNLMKNTEILPPLLRKDYENGINSECADRYVRVKPTHLIDKSLKNGIQTLYVDERIENNGKEDTSYPLPSADIMLPTPKKKIEIPKTLETSRYYDQSFSAFDRCKKMKLHRQSNDHESLNKAIASASLGNTSELSIRREVPIYEQQDGYLQTQNFQSRDPHNFNFTLNKCVDEHEKCNNDSSFQQWKMKMISDSCFSKLPKFQNSNFRTLCENDESFDAFNNRINSNDCEKHEYARITTWFATEQDRQGKLKKRKLKILESSTTSNNENVEMDQIIDDESSGDEENLAHKNMSDTNIDRASIGVLSIAIRRRVPEDDLTNLSFNLGMEKLRERQPNPDNELIYDDDNDIFNLQNIWFCHISLDKYLK